jgi:hypothetical protein
MQAVSEYAMNLPTMVRWRRALFLVSGLLGLSGVLLYGLERTARDYYDVLQQADTYYHAAQYQEAIAAYEHALVRASAPTARASTWILGGVGSPAHVSLWLANSHYRLAETEMVRYQKAARESRSTPRPTLETVQRLLTTAGKAYEAVPHTVPHIAQAAQVNAVRVAAWQLILTAFDEQTPGGHSLRQQAWLTVQRAAQAVDYSHAHQASLSRQGHMTAMLLLETLTAVSQEKAPPSPPVSAGDALRNPLGDLLLKDSPDLSQQERERFRQFFFALPIEARDPWPSERRGSAGAGGGRTGH